MKTSMIAVCFALLLFSSCKKDWVCACDNSITGESKISLEDQTLNEARTECKSREFDNAFGEQTCRLE